MVKKHAGSRPAAGGGPDVQWMGCVSSRHAVYVTAIYAILLSIAILTATPILFNRYEAKFRNFIVFIYIGVTPFLGWIPMSLLLVYSAAKGWTKLAFCWMLYTILITSISLLQICYWIRTFMELVKQESFRPDMLVITGVLLVITIVNCVCIDIVSAYRRQKLKEMTNLSPCYAAYLLENIADLDEFQQLPEDPRLPEIRRLRPYDSPGRDSGTPITVTQHSTPSQTPKHTAVHQHSTLCSDCNGVGVECGVSNNRLVTNREPRQNGVCSDFSEGKTSSTCAKHVVSSEGRDEDELSPLQPVRRCSPSIRADRRYSVVRLDNGRMGLLEHDQLATSPARNDASRNLDNRRVRSVTERHAPFMTDRRPDARSKSAI